MALFPFITTLLSYTYPLSLKLHFYSSLGSRSSSANRWVFSVQSLPSSLRVIAKDHCSCLLVPCSGFSFFLRLHHPTRLTPLTMRPPLQNRHPELLSSRLYNIVLSCLLIVSTAKARNTAVGYMQTSYQRTNAVHKLDYIHKDMVTRVGTCSSNGKSVGRFQTGAIVACCSPASSFTGT